MGPQPGCRGGHRAWRGEGGAHSQDGWNGGQGAATGCQAPPSRACLCVQAWRQARDTGKTKQKLRGRAAGRRQGRDSHQPALTANGIPPMRTYSHSNSSVEHGVGRPDLPDHPRGRISLHYRHLFPMPGGPPPPFSPAPWEALLSKGHPSWESHGPRECICPLHCRSALVCTVCPCTKLWASAAQAPLCLVSEPPPTGHGTLDRRLIHSALRLPAAKRDGHITVPRSERLRAQCLCGADSGGAAAGPTGQWE